MAEYWDIYDANRKKTGRLAERGVTELKFGEEYHIVVSAIIMNSKNEMLISQRAPHKGLGLQWEFNGGSILAGETSLEGILRELKEELGLEFSKKEAIYFKEVRGRRFPNFKDMWLFKKDIDIKDVKFNDGEAIDVKWVSIEEFEEMFNNKEIIDVIDFGVEEYERAVSLQQRESYGYIGKKVNVKVDRPLGSSHSKKYADHIYPINYGYVPYTISGDGKELDAYILGVDVPLQEFEGKCIAVIHRTNDDDDKLIIVPEEKEFSDEEIRNLTNFQEQYFESEIIR